MSNKLYLYNTLTRKKEEFKPIKKGQIGLYTCGPTVYNYAHIGNLRTYIFEDILKRVLIYNNYKVKHIMNVTDVGHLTGDRDMGEDKMEQSAKKEGKDAWQIADFYWQAFKDDMKKLNLSQPDIWCKATDNIKTQIKLIKKLEKKGFTYAIEDGIYFDTSKFKNYTKLSRQNLEALKEGARVEKNDGKKNPTDFALWKFSPKNEKRQMEWKSPWGVGFPGWHIECSAMSMKYLKKQLDIHCGGIDHINIHHTNEIAQSEAATGKQFFNYWLHGAFLNIPGGKKMAKSEKNFLTLKNALIKKNINPLSYRYAALQVHYRKPMEYSEKSIKSAENGLNNLYNEIKLVGAPLAGAQSDKSIIGENYQQKFLSIINDDLNMPQALALVWDLLKSNLKPEIKKATLLDFDKVLGLDLNKIKKEKAIIPDEIKKLAAARQQARQEKNFSKADKLRSEIKKLGFEIEDTSDGFEIKKL
ncbi:MAG: cysteine--tRNA ligase [Candidatus Kuenenbacteria bacterium]